MKSEWLLLVILAMGGWVGCSSPSHGSAAAQVDLEHFDAEALTKAIVMETNRARSLHGVPRLKTNRALDRAAEKQAVMMAWRFDVSHDNPVADNADPYARVRQQGLAPSKLGENVASLPVRDTQTGKPRTYAELAGDFVQAWLESPAHRSKLLDASFVSIGCGARGAYMPRDVPMVFAAQVFFTP